MRSIPKLNFQRAKQSGAALLVMLMLVMVVAASVLVNALGTPGEGPELRSLAALGEARQALIGFAQTHGRLPRPARSATDGREAQDRCDSEADCSGYLPWAALGVARSDAWGKLWRYSVSPAFTEQPLDIGRTMAGKIVQTRDGAGVRSLAGQAQCANAGSDCVAAVVLSTGQRNFGTSELGIAQANAALTNRDERNNARASKVFIQRTRSGDAAAAGGEFDDLVAWIDLEVLYKRMGAAGALPDDGRNRRSAFE